MTPEEMQQKKDEIIEILKGVNDEQLKDFAFFLRNLLADDIDRDDISDDDKENYKRGIDTCNKILYGK